MFMVSEQVKLALACSTISHKAEDVYLEVHIYLFI